MTLSRARLGVLVAVIASSLPLQALSAAPLPALRPAGVAAAGQAALGTPVLSLRREPDLLARTVAGLKLASSLDAALSDPQQGAGGQWCMQATVNGRTIYSHRATDAFIPASNLKLLTATAVVDTLGADSRLRTLVQAAAPASGGKINGDLYLLGGGDPLLATGDYVANLHYRAQVFDDLNVLADLVKSAGVTQVMGRVVGDESRYDTQRYLPTWPARYATSGEIGPISALSVNDGYTALIPVVVPAPEPAQQAAATFSRLLVQRGIAVGAPAAVGVSPAGTAKIAELVSPPLAQVVGEILRRSDNNGAELLTKELGRHANPKTPTTAAGVAVIAADLQAAGLPVGPLHQVDGSGLDRSDRASCELLLAALARNGPDGVLGQGLAVAGKSGTLEHRLVATAAAGRLRAKTGSLDGVSALTGFMMPGPAPSGTTGPGPPPVAFSLLVNGLPTIKAGDALEDRIGLLLARFPEVAPVSQLAPSTAGG